MYFWWIPINNSVFSLRMVKFLHLIVQEFKWFELFWVEKIENSNRIFGRFLGSWWLFLVNYSKLSECNLHDMYWEFDRNLKKKINPGPFCMIIYTFIIGFEKLPSNWVLQGHNISLQSDKTFSSLKSKKVWKWCMTIPQREN